MMAADYIRDVFKVALPAWWNTPKDDLKALTPAKFFPQDFNASKPKPKPAAKP